VWLYIGASKTGLQSFNNFTEYDCSCVGRNKISLEMIASTAFSVIFLLVIVTKTSSINLATAKKGMAKPLYDAPHVDNQNSVPVSETINPLLIIY